MKDIKVPRQKITITSFKKKLKEKSKKPEKIYRQLGVTKSIYQRIDEYNQGRKPMARAMNDLLEEALESQGF